MIDKVFYFSLNSGKKGILLATKIRKLKLFGKNSFSI